MSASEWAAVRGTADVGGIFHARSETDMASITDGTSNTYLAGEKYLAPDYYDNGLGGCDDQGWNCGRDCDTLRWTINNAAYLPRQDQSGYASGLTFGSAHAIGLHMAFCDGSVQFINYSIDMETHYRLGNRHDGLTIDGKAF